MAWSNYVDNAFVTLAVGDVDFETFWYPALRTSAQIDITPGVNAVRTGEVYLLIDEVRLTVGTAANVHKHLVKQDKGGGSDPWTWQKPHADVFNSAVADTLAVWAK